MSQANDTPITAPARRRSFLFTGSGTWSNDAPKFPRVIESYDLIRLGAELRVAWAAEVAAVAAMPAEPPYSGEDLEAMDEIWMRTGQTVDRISREVPHTLTGLLIMARAVSWCFSGQNIEHPGDGPATIITNAILNELVRMDHERDRLANSGVKGVL